MGSELNALLDELSGRIERLKIEYEKYFLGIEKLEPIQERKEIAQIVRRFQTTPVGNTALKYRLNSLHQRFLSYQNYWNRIVRQIEAGTYIRDLARVERDLKRKGVDANLTKVRSKGELEAALMDQLRQADDLERAEAAGGPSAAAPVPGPGAPSEEADALSGYFGGKAPPPVPGARPAGPPPVPGGRGPGAPPPAPPVGASGADERMKRLYRAYIAAKRKVGEPTDGITYDRLVKTLQKQVPMIQQKTGCRQVDFKIEIRDGKAILKAVPRT